MDSDDVSIDAHMSHSHEASRGSGQRHHGHGQGALGGGLRASSADASHFDAIFGSTRTHTHTHTYFASLSLFSVPDVSYNHTNPAVPTPNTTVFIYLCIYVPVDALMLSNRWEYEYSEEVDAA